MSRKSGNIVKYTAAELRALEKRGEIKTDLEGGRQEAPAFGPRSGRCHGGDRLAHDGVAQVAAQGPHDAAARRRRARLVPRARAKAIRSRINAILRKYFEQHTR